MVSLQTDFGMSPDITSEVKILTLNYDAQYGNTTSGQIIVETKSGSDKFHGAGYEYLRNDALNAFQYGTAAGIRKPGDKENDFGANVGGPMYLPHLDGSNSFLKGYFYFNWEGFQDHGGANSAVLSVASDNDRAGNFSAIATQLYYPNDPAKFGADAGTPIAYGGSPNQIDPKYEDPSAKAWMALLPKPTSGGEMNNYFVPVNDQGSLTSSENVYFARADLDIGSKDHLYYTYWWQYTGVNTDSALPLSVSTAIPASPENSPIQRFNWERTFSNVMTNHFTAGYLNRNEGRYSAFDRAPVVPPSVPGVSMPKYAPQLNFGGSSSNDYSQLGNQFGLDNLTTRPTTAVNDIVTRVMGNHTLKVGVEWHAADGNIHNGNNQGGTMTFIDRCINNAIINIEVLKPYAQAEGERGSSGGPAQARFGVAG
jgi:hypothetical protein